MERREPTARGIRRPGCPAPAGEAEVRARKRFGQHFLEDVWVRKVVAAIDPQPDDVFLEIGPGAAR